MVSEPKKSRIAYSKTSGSLQIFLSSVLLAEKSIVQLEKPFTVQPSFFKRCRQIQSQPVGQAGGNCRHQDDINDEAELTRLGREQLDLLEPNCKNVEKAQI